MYKSTIWELFILGMNGFRLYAIKNSVLASIRILGRGNSLSNCFSAVKLVRVLAEKRWHGGTVNCELLQICKKKWRGSNKGWLRTLGLVTGMSPPLLLPIPRGDHFWIPETSKAATQSADIGEGLGALWKRSPAQQSKRREHIYIHWPPFPHLHWWSRSKNYLPRAQSRMGKDRGRIWKGKWKIASTKTYSGKVDQKQFVTSHVESNETYKLFYFVSYSK